jgi:hypothetical protein
MAALFYSLNTVRITGYAKSLSAVDIAAGKSLVLAAAALASLLVTAASLAQQGQPVLSLWEGWVDPGAWAVMVWLAVGPGALASYLSVKVGLCTICGWKCISCILCESLKLNAPERA